MTTTGMMERILAKLEQLRVRCPELRFGQLIATVGMLVEDETGHSLWDVDDGDFATALDRFTDDMARRELRTEPIARPDRAVPSSPTVSQQ